MKPWSNLQKRVYAMASSEVSFQIHFVAYPMRSQCGSSLIPRCFVTIGKRIIWDYPRDFAADCSSPYSPGVKAHSITSILHQWLDTPGSRLLEAEYPEDEWGLTDILLAIDRRMGRRRLMLLAQRTRNVEVLAIIATRLGLPGVPGLLNVGPESANMPQPQSESPPSDVDYGKELD
jgi:hypothetical protein